MILVSFCSSASLKKVNAVRKDFSFQFSGIQCGDDFSTVNGLFPAIFGPDFLITVSFKVTELDVKDIDKCKQQPAMNLKLLNKVRF